MEKITISKNGLRFSPLVAGVMKWGEWGANHSPQEILKLIEASIDCGVTTFDHADIYGGYSTEELFGEALKLDSGIRNRMELVSKCGIRMPSERRPENRIKSYDTTESYIIHSVECSLKNLNIDFLDLLLIHRPSPLMSFHEMASAFDKLIQSGKVRAVGVSNFMPHQFESLNKLYPLVTNQIEISTLARDPFLNGQLDQAQVLGFSPMAWSPLGGGSFFTEKENTDQIKRLKSVASGLMEKYEVGLDQILLAWLLHHPSKIIPVLGTSKQSRIASSVDALKIKMEDQDWFALWQAAEGQEVP